MKDCEPHEGYYKLLNYLKKIKMKIILFALQILTIILKEQVLIKIKFMKFMVQ